MAVLIAILLSSIAMPVRAEFDAKRSEKGVVLIIALSKKGWGTGSGFVVSDDGHVVTNYHVIEGATDIGVIPVGTNLGSMESPGKKTVEEIKEAINRGYPARVYDQSRELDFAILKVEGLGSGKAVPLNPTLPNRGDVVYAFGFPGAAATLMKQGISSDPTLTQGIVGRSVLSNKGGGRRNDIQHDASISWGNSGGPLFNECSEVIGVNTNIAIIEKKGKPSDYLHAAGFNAAFSVGDFVDRLSSRGINAMVNRDACTPDGDQTLVVSAGVVAAVLVLGFGGYLVYARQRRPAPVPPPARPASRAPAPAHQSRQPTADDQDLTQVAGGTSGRAGPPPGARGVLCTLTESGPGGSSRVDLGPNDFADKTDGCVLGRSLKVAHLQAEDSSVSRRHARIKYTAGRFEIEDLNSSNGTFVNDNRLKPFSPEPLPDGAVIRLGSYELTFSRKA